jgi:hypothetical protein
MPLKAEDCRQINRDYRHSPGGYTCDRSQADVRRELAAHMFLYIHVPTANFLCSVPFGLRGWVHVIGHPEDGSYEWVATLDAEHVGDPRLQLAWSNVGYGSAIGALRDALNFLDV